MTTIWIHYIYSRYISFLDVPDLKKVHFVRQITLGLNHSWIAAIAKNFIEPWMASYFFTVFSTLDFSKTTTVVQDRNGSILMEPSIRCDNVSAWRTIGNSYVWRQFLCQTMTDPQFVVNMSLNCSCVQKVYWYWNSSPVLNPLKSPVVFPWIVSFKNKFSCLQASHFSNLQKFKTFYLVYFGLFSKN